MATAEEAEAAAERAATRLTLLQAENPTVARLKDWWGRHYARAGHRRLGRLLLGASPYSRREDDAEDNPELEAVVRQATDELADLRRDDAEAVRRLEQWWREHYFLAGHRRLGRLLIAAVPRTHGQGSEQPDAPQSRRPA